MEKYPDYRYPTKKPTAWKWAPILLLLPTGIALYALHHRSSVPQPENIDTVLEDITTSFEEKPRFVATRYVISDTHLKQTAKEFFDSDKWRVELPDGETIINDGKQVTDYLPSAKVKYIFPADIELPTGKGITPSKRRNTPWDKIIDAGDFLMRLPNTVYQSALPIRYGNGTAYLCLFTSPHRDWRSSLVIPKTDEYPLMIQNRLQMAATFSPLSQTNLSYPSSLSASLFDPHKLPGRSVPFEQAMLDSYKSAEKPVVRGKPNDIVTSINDVEIDPSGYLFLLYKGQLTEGLHVKDEAGNSYLQLGSWNFTPFGTGVRIGKDYANLAEFVPVKVSRPAWPLKLRLNVGQGSRSETLVFQVNQPISTVVPPYCFWIDAPNTASGLHRESLKALAAYYELLAFNAAGDKRNAYLKQSTSLNEKYIATLFSDGEDPFGFRARRLSEAYGLEFENKVALGDSVSAGGARAEAELLGSLVYPQVPPPAIR